jgi:hypothetical protein
MSYTARQALRAPNAQQTPQAITLAVTCHRSTRQRPPGRSRSVTKSPTADRAKSRRSALQHQYVETSPALCRSDILRMKVGCVLQVDQMGDPEVGVLGVRQPCGASRARSISSAVSSGPTLCRPPDHLRAASSKFVVTADPTW